ncbi:MAG: low molecular weight protein arginine phosphatase [Clostridia bacterium]|nr:low molecular weight protein arginine phosphatase [Clostridia bacterium]
MILFVCTGNTCRSPMAAAMAGKMGLEAASAGLSAFPGVPATPQAIRAARRHGGDLSGHRAQMVTAQLVKAADFICPMTRSHALGLLERFPDCAGKIILPSPEIPDPYGGDDAVYEACIQSLISMVEKIAAQ